LRLSRSASNNIRILVLRVLKKMIAYGLCQRTTGYDKPPSMFRLVPPKPPRHTLQEIYQRLGEIARRQIALEELGRRNAYHWDRYALVFHSLAA
jgi:hypothetical protein